MRATYKLFPASLAAAYRRRHRPDPGRNQVYDGGESLAAREGRTFGRAGFGVPPPLNNNLSKSSSRDAELFGGCAADVDQQEEGGGMKVEGGHQRRATMTMGDKGAAMMIR